MTSPSEQHQPPLVQLSSAPASPSAEATRSSSGTSRSPTPYLSPYPPLTSGSDLAESSRSASNTLSAGGSERSGRSGSPDYSAFATASNMPQKTLSTKEKETLLETLRTHRVNTLIELRRIERLLMQHKASGVTEALTKAWAHYVNSNNLLTELRGLTRTYPFSSECLDEAKWMVISDTRSGRSWNYCWLVLQKIKNQNLIPKHARQLAARPAMWGGRSPSAQGIEQLAQACTLEWTRALSQLLRHWEAPPTS